MQQRRPGRRRPGSVGPDAIHIDADTRLIALLGYPVGQTLSPFIHNTAFAAQGVNFAFAAFPVSPERIGDGVRGLAALHFAGAGVTIPHKQAVLPYLDELSPCACAVGASNIIVRRRDGTLFGDNTDVTGFLAPLHSLADRLEGADMAVLGAGGAARAVAYALLVTFRPKRLTLIARTPSKADMLATDLTVFDERKALEVHAFSSARAAVRDARLVVNTTPVGMYPAVNDSPWRDVDDFGDDHIVYDIVYNPEETRLLGDAASRGAVTIGGLDMLVEQAAAAYVQWTGHKMPVDVVRNALRTRSLHR